MPRTAIVLVIILLLLAGSVWLQIFLSKKKNKWLGLIIPFFCFLLSIAAVFSLSMFNHTSISLVTDGIKTTVVESDKPDMPSIIAAALPVFLISNIPTAIFASIYFACREKMKLRTELDKMNIQDLE